MENKKDPFNSIFEGIDLPEDFAAKLKTAFDEVVAEKVLEATSKLGPVDTAPEAYAVGMSKAMKSTGDKPPLKKGTIKKAHNIAKGVMKSADIEEEEEEIVRLESEDEMEDEEGEEVYEAEEPKTYTPEDIRALLTDIDIVRLLQASDEERSKFFNSMRAAVTDLSGNAMAETFLSFIMSILQVLADDPRISTMVAREIKNSGNMETDQTADTTQDENLEVYENVVESVDKYLTYVAESWIKENELAVEQGLKIEIMESFWSGLKNMFVEHNISVPEETNVVEDLKSKIKDLESTISEEKQSFVDELAKQKEEYETKLNEEINKSIQYKTKAIETTKKSIFESVSRGLSLSQKERFSKLVESVSYETKKTYEEKLKEIAKNAFDSSKTKKKLTEDSMVEPSENDVLVTDNPIMNLYSEAISRKLKF
jgi:hypothetical protein